MIPDNSKLIGNIVGVLTGLVAGFIIAAYVIFPVLIGYTLIEVLRLLSK